MQGRVESKNDGKNLTKHAVMFYFMHWVEYAIRVAL